MKETEIRKNTNRLVTNQMKEKNHKHKGLLTKSYRLEGQIQLLKNPIES